MNQAFVVQVTDPLGATRQHAVADRAALIGKASSCSVRLQGWRVGREHARIYRSPQGLVIEDLGHLGGTWINGSRVVLHGPLLDSDEITIGGFRLRVQESITLAAAAIDHQAPLTLADALGSAGHILPKTAAAAVSAASAPAPVAVSKPSSTPSQARPAAAAAVMPAAHFVWRRRLHELLLETIDLRRRDFTRMSDAEVRGETESVIRELLAQQTDLPAEIDRATLMREVLDEAVTLGPLEALLADESVSEIMVNRHDEVFIERAGRLQRHATVFSSDRAVLGVIERIVAPLGRRIDESSPLVDARLKDGSRVNAVIPPLALKGPTLTIRKFMARRLAVEDLIGFGALSAPMAEFLRTAVNCRKNIVVAGGTGSGKTTFLNVLSNFIPDGERIVTIEDAAELKLNHSHLVSLESRPANTEGRGQISIRDLVRNSLRMRPDRIVVGECRGGEALDMLQAMNTGHEGSLTTLHANSPRDALARLETLVLMAGMDLPLVAIREQIASAVDLLVQQSRFACGARKVTSICEVCGIENGRIQLQELFRYEQRGHQPDGRVRGHFSGCDTVPAFYEDLRARGQPVDLSIFARVDA